MVVDESQSAQVCMQFTTFAYVGARLTTAHDRPFAQGPRPPQPVHTALASPPLAHDAETKPRVQELEPRGGKGDGDRKSGEGGEGKKGSHGGGASRGAEAARATTPAHRPPRSSAVSPSRMMCPAGARSKLAVVRPSAAPGSRQEKIARALAESAKAQAKESVGTKATARAVVKVEASVSSREETGREAGASATATSLVEMRWAPAVEARALSCRTHCVGGAGFVRSPRGTFGHARRQALRVRVSHW